MSGDEITAFDLVAAALRDTGLPEWIHLANRMAPDFDSLVANGGRVKVACNDGFTMSVIAHGGAYCSPRPGWLRDDDTYEDDSFCGPFTQVEVGFPSEQPEPWDVWGEYAESPEEPTETVYGWVPVEMVKALIELHGGEK